MTPLKVWRHLTFSIGFHTWRCVDCIAKQTIPRHLQTNHPCTHRTWTHENTHPNTYNRQSNFSITVSHEQTDASQRGQTALCSTCTLLNTFMTHDPHRCGCRCVGGAAGWVCGGFERSERPPAEQETCGQSRVHAVSRSSREVPTPPCKHRRWSPPGGATQKHIITLVK